MGADGCASSDTEVVASGTLNAVETFVLGYPRGLAEGGCCSFENCCSLSNCLFCCGGMAAVSRVSTWENIVFAFVPIKRRLPTTMNKHAAATTPQEINSLPSHGLGVGTEACPTSGATGRKSPAAGDSTCQACRLRETLLKSAV